MRCIEENSVKEGIQKCIPFVLTFTGESNKTADIISKHWDLLRQNVANVPEFQILPLPGAHPVASILWGTQPGDPPAAKFIPPLGRGRVKVEDHGIP